MIPVQTAQHAIDAILRQDPDTLAAVRQLAGKVIAIEILGPKITFCLEFHAGGITLKTAPDDKPNVTIRARPVAFMALVLDRGDSPGATSPEMEILGDAGLAQRFQQILTAVEIDWEEHLAAITGDTAAHKLGRFIQHARTSLREARETIGMDISEYLRYEKEILPVREEVDEFIAAVDELRNDAERLRLRIERLQSGLTDGFQRHA